MNPMYEILLLAAILNLSKAQVDGNSPFDSGGRNLLPKLIKKPSVKPARTVADTAEEYWIENQCKYPPKTFFSMFRDACDVRLRSETFSAGICQALFNSSKNLCTLEGAGEDEIQTMLSIHELQSTMDDDELCDTLAEMKENNPNLFPKMTEFTGKYEWFQSVASLLFSPETCSNACSMGNMHPICFGYMLNYNYIGSLPSPLSYETEDDDVDINEEKVNQVNGVTSNPAEANTPGSSAKNSADKHTSDMIKKPPFDFEGKSSSQLFRPNPKLMGAKFNELDQYFYGDEIGDMDGKDINSPVKLNKTPISLVDILDLDSVGLSESPDDENDDFLIDSNMPIENLPQYSDEFLMKIGNVPVNRHKLRGYVNRMDKSEEMPMLAVVLTISGILAIVCFFLLFSVRKKIGIYMKYVRQKRRNNWNYERVFAVQPDDDDYYE